MSYILDALKKAESERHPGPPPHLHAPPPLFIAQPSAPSLWRRASTWIGLAAAAALTALAWLKPWQTAPSAPAVVASAPAPQPAPKIADAPAQPAPAAPAVGATPPQEAPPAPVNQKAQPAAEKKPAKAASRPQARSAKESKPTQPVAPEAESRVATLHELPEHIRSEIPALSINGYLYSGNKADRTVLINKRLMHEGDQIAPDLTLEKLTPTGMVLNYKGYRYRTSY